NTWLKQIAGNNNGLAWASYLINNNDVGNGDTYNVCYGNDANYNPFSCSDDTQSCRYTDKPYLAFLSI
ncbi:MAG TPA: hypothetical protein VEH06_11880, partial [Candidatus Bathyarchaeia archaeon]|nr:hypothetical protein [Candidatus Bathyarchaeia archaeon]